MKRVLMLMLTSSVSVSLGSVDSVSLGSGTSSDPFGNRSFVSPKKGSPIPPERSEIVIPESGGRSGIRTLESGRRSGSGAAVVRWKRQSLSDSE